MKPTSTKKKIKVRETSLSKQKHLVVRALLMLHLKIKHKRDAHWIKLYPKFPVIEGKICDIYYENIRTKEAYAYEIQENITPEWEDEIKKIYEGWEVYGMNTVDYITIDLNKLSDDLKELGSQIRGLIF